MRNALENPILKRLRDRLGVEPGRVDPVWLLTLLDLLEVDQYSLEDWNGALSEAMGRRVFCPSYASLSRYLHRAVLEVE